MKSSFSFDDFELTHLGKNRNCSVRINASGYYYSPTCADRDGPGDPAEVEIRELTVLAFNQGQTTVNRDESPEWFQVLDSILHEYCNYENQQLIVNKVEFDRCYEKT